MLQNEGNYSKILYQNEGSYYLNTLNRFHTLGYMTLNEPIFINRQLPWDSGK